MIIILDEISYYLNLLLIFAFFYLVYLLISTIIKSLKNNRFVQPENKALLISATFVILIKVFILFYITGVKKDELLTILKDEFHLVINNKDYNSAKDLKGELSINSYIEKKISGSKPLGANRVKIYSDSKEINLLLRKDSKNEEINWVYYETKYMDYHLGYIKYDLDKHQLNNKKVN